MNWKEIKVSADNTHFLFNDKPIFDTKFIEVLKFHSPGLAPVKDESGSYHIDSLGNQLYANRFTRTFGYYFNRAAVVHNDKWFHLTEEGEKAYIETYNWTGNYQENLCSVCNIANEYFHIDPDGDRIYRNSYVYCGDFKDGFACVKTANGHFRHIDNKGEFINNKSFIDLGVFHKNYATAMDKDGWFHIDKLGCEIYKHRFLAVEPFYNGFALVTQFDKNKIIINEQGNKVVSI